MRIGRAPRWVIGVVTMLVVVGVVSFLVSRRAGGGQGRVLFDVVPNQQDSPLSILSVTLRPDWLKEPLMRLQNDSTRIVRGVRVAVLVTAPESSRTIVSDEILVTLGPGATAIVTAAVPALWKTTAWNEYPTGALLTIGLASVLFADTTRWQPGTPPGQPFSVPPQTRLGPPVDVGRYPLWFMPGLGSVGLATTTSRYPINGALSGGQCVMTACGPTPQWCEYNGCMLR